MITRERKELEEQVLRKYLPCNAFHFMDFPGTAPYLILAAKTSNHKLYTLRIELSSFPESVPKVFVTKMLKTRTGANMNGASGSMHTLTSEHGWTRICHYGNDWTNRVSLFRVYYKCLMWLNMYELHLQTGESIDTYLNHQPM